MLDAWGREITYLRLSVTDLCNLRCLYCMPSAGVVKRPRRDILSLEEISAIIRAAARCGIKKVRLTGGEPLVRRGLTDVCRLAAGVPGIEELCLTTNGTLLPEMAGELRAAGVNRLNLSLDSLDDLTYREITRLGRLEAALAGLEAALAAGFDAIKVNAVLIGGLNDGEIARLVGLTERGLQVRFIELMPVGERAGWSRSRFVPNSTVLRAVPELEPLGRDGVAELYRRPGYSGSVGLISPVSAHFCQSCDRIRVTSDGLLKPCLHSRDALNLRGLSEDALEAALRSAALLKPRRHGLAEGLFNTERNMNAIGG